MDESPLLKVEDMETVTWNAFGDLLSETDTHWGGVLKCHSLWQTVSI